MPKLKRTLSLTQCTLMGVGVMLGAGIYTLVGQAAAMAGNAVWVSFLLASLVASCTGLSYAELSSFIPKAGGEYYYARRAFGNLVAFLVSWLLVIGIGIASAAVALGFAGYLFALTGFDPIWSACLIVAASAGLLVYGIEQSAWVAGFCTALELIGLIIVMAVGIPNLGTIDYLEMTPAGYSGVISAGALIFFAYIGFEEIVQLSEETRNPTRNIPRAVLLSIAITTVLYVLVAASAVSVMGWEKLGASESPIADVAAVALGQKAFWGMSIIALFSTGNTVLILIMSATRVLYGMAEGGQMPKRLATIHQTRKSPYVATLAVAAVAVVMIITLKNIAMVANLTNFTLLAAFVVINVAVVVLRYREPDTQRPFRVPGHIGRLPLIPLMGIASSLFMISYVGWTPTLIGSCVGVVGLLVYLARVGRTDHTERPSSKAKSKD
jgi:APA family basic amino acid/polyamine antiporter